MGGGGGSTDIGANVDNFCDAACLAGGVVAGGHEDCVLVLSEWLEKGVGIVDEETLDVDGDGD